MDNQTIDIPDDAEDLAEQAAVEFDTAAILDGLAQTTGDISEALTDEQLSILGAQVVEDYEADKAERSEWEKIARESLDKASQEKGRDEKTYPWSKASNVQYPLLTVAALQFNARAYPAIVKGDEAVSVKVVGADNGVPQLGPDGRPALQVNNAPVMPTPQGLVVAMPQGLVPLPPGTEPQPAWAKPPGAKAARAKRVSTYLNSTIFYRMDGWEADTDMLLMQLPIVGCAFRKVYYKGGQNCAKLVSALNLVVPCDTKEIRTATRISELLPPMAPFEVLENIKSGYFRPAQFIDGEEFDGKSRTLIEQHLRYDLDGDKYPEPYIVTVDHESREVVRVVANYGPDDIKRKPDGTLMKIEAGQYYVKYGFFPHPEGKFYDIGLGHLLASIGNVIETLVNQMIDANTVAVAGGGFIGSGVRLQGTNRSTTIKLAPGEWKPVNVSGDQLRNAMVERTVPQISPITMNVLELLLGVAQDISSAKDVLTGDASNNGQVGTTLALIEQGLQMFTACYKRIFRSLKDEFQLLFDNTGKHATAETMADYKEVLDDPSADLKADFAEEDMDIRPVSDPTSVTKMQEMAKAQFLMSLAPMAVQASSNPVLRAILRRVLAAGNIEDPDEILVEAPPPQPNPKDVASAQDDLASAGLKQAQAAQIAQDMEIKRVEKAADAFLKGTQAHMSVAA